MDQYNWEDITPLSIEETETPQLCHILYSDEYKQVMGYLRRLMSMDEHSERALYLTELAIEMVPAHYTVWQFRFALVKALHKDVVDELAWCDDVALNNQKNYQIWHYRQSLIEFAGVQFDPTNESPLVETMLVEDNKNYHVWSYKKWLAEHFKLYDSPKELQFVDRLLEIDVRNNSAWNYRYFLMVHRADFDLDLELQYVQARIDRAPQNESPWNYLVGICSHFRKPLADLEPFCTKYAALSQDQDVEIIVQSTHAFELLARIYTDLHQTHKSVDIYRQLAEKYDPIRANYWNYRISLIV